MGEDSLRLQPLGVRHTYVANCQGVARPCLNGWDPRVHKRVVLDEPSRDLVDACKVLLQAALEGTELEITVEIQARREAGFEEALQRTVRENANTLGFDNHSFEED